MKEKHILEIVYPLIVNGKTDMNDKFIIELLDKYINEKMSVFSEFYVHYSDLKEKKNRIGADTFEHRMYSIGKTKGFDSPEYRKIREYNRCKEYRSVPISKFGVINGDSTTYDFKDISHSFERYIIEGKKILGEINIHQTYNGIKVCENIDNYVLRPIVIKDSNGFRILRVDIITKR